LEIRAKLLNPSRFLDRFRHKALGDSQTLTPVAGLIFETKIESFFLESFFLESFFLEQHYCPRTLFPSMSVSGFIFPELEHLYKNIFTASFPKRSVRNVGCSFVSKKRTRPGSNASSRVGKDQLHPKTLVEIGMVLSTNSGSFPSNSHVSATFSILLRFGESWNPANCEKFNADGSQMGRTNLDKSVW